MTDLISRQAAIDALGKAMPKMTTPDGCGQFDHEIQIADEAFIDAAQIIHDLPSVQPEIVRCKDCTRFDPRRGCNLVEGLNIAKADSFCSYGERKTDE